MFRYVTSPTSSFSKDQGANFIQGGDLGIGIIGCTELDAACWVGGYNRYMIVV